MIVIFLLFSTLCLGTMYTGYHMRVNVFVLLIIRINAIETAIREIIRERYAKGIEVCL
jgi:hypothetical protein